MIRKYRLIIILLVMSLSVTGCTSLKEIPVEFAKSIWGSSTKALEGARPKAIKKTFRCSFDQCFDAVVKLTQTEAPKPAVEKGEEASNAHTDAMGDGDLENLDVLIKRNTKVLDLFIENRPKRHIVVMGVPGSVNTTEVGIFFGSAGGSSTQVEISSLSKNAKKTVSELVFKELGGYYQEVSQ